MASGQLHVRVRSAQNQRRAPSVLCTAAHWTPLTSAVSCWSPGNGSGNCIWLRSLTWKNPKGLRHSNAAWCRSALGAAEMEHRMGRQPSGDLSVHASGRMPNDTGRVPLSLCSGGCGGDALLDELEQHNGTATCPYREAREHREAPLRVASEAPPRHVVGLGCRRQSDGVGMVVWPGTDPAREASARGQAGPQASALVHRCSLITQSTCSRTADA